MEIDSEKKPKETIEWGDVPYEYEDGVLVNRSSLSWAIMEIDSEKKLKETIEWGDVPYEYEDGILVQHWYELEEAEIFLPAYHLTIGVGKLKEEIIEKQMPGVKDIRKVWDQPVSWKKRKGLI